jgi:putative ATP-binding cassette transporter
VVAAPRFFSGAIQLGELMQISSAFGQVQGALSWFVDSYSSLATWRATTDRLTGFEASFKAVAPVAYAKDGIATRGTDLTVALPTGAVILAHTALQVNAGDTVLLKGPSGSGKSTLFRTLAGIWPFSTGQVERAPETMFLPQRAYFPEGPLRDALAYPQPANAYTDAALTQALQDALLPGLTGQLDVSDAWGQKLSGGEQQRLAIARALLKKPKWIFADESTSALDEAAEATLYQRLTNLVAERGGGLVSIAHRPGVAAFHKRHWVLEPQAPGAEALFTLAEKPA